MNLKRTRLSLLALAGWLAFFANISLAVPLSQLFQGGTITADDKIFDNFSQRSLQQVNGGIANLNLIDVVPLVDDPLNPGIKFNMPVDPFVPALGTPFGHTGPSSVLLEFSFRVRTTTGLPLIKDNSLLINGFLFDAGPNAFIEITEEVLASPRGPLLGEKRVIARPGDQPNSGDPDHFDEAAFAPRSSLFVIKRINIQGPGINDGAFLTMFEQRFSQVPEPSSILIVGVLLACGMSSSLWRRCR